MSFSVTTAGAVYSAADGTYTYTVMPFRDIMRPDLLNAKYKMRLTVVSHANPILNGNNCYMANVRLGNNAVFDMSFNGTYSQHYAILPLANNAGVVGSYSIMARPDDNAAISVSNIKDVNTITIIILANRAALLTQVTLQTILHFEPIIE